MTAATRQLKIKGYLATETATATILINGVEAYNGPVADGQTGPMLPSNTVDLASFTFAGQSIPAETIVVTVTMTSGSAAFGSMFVNRERDPLAEPVWLYPNSGTDDGRTNISINGVAVQWPSDGGPTVPGGTPENPNWTGWTFILDEGDTLEFDYQCMALQSVA